MDEVMVSFLVVTIIVPALAVGFFALLFGLSRVLSTDGLERISSGSRSWKPSLSMAMAWFVAAALVMVAMSSHRPGPALLAITLLALWVLAWFVRNWRKEFVFLMGLRDDDLPGRHDKLIWAAVLIAAAPVGVWFFRSYRLAHWPEPKAVFHDEFSPEPSASGAMAPSA